MKNDCGKLVTPISNTDIKIFVDKKIIFFIDVVQNIMLNAKESYSLGIITGKKMNDATMDLLSISSKLLAHGVTTGETAIKSMQLLNNDISSVIRSVGCNNLEDLLKVCFGNTTCISDKSHELQSTILLKFMRPTGYNIANLRSGDVFGCTDQSTTSSHFYTRIHGVCVCIPNTFLKKTITVFGVFRDVVIPLYQTPIMVQTIKTIMEHASHSNSTVLLDTLTLTDIVCYDATTLLQKFNEYSILSNATQCKTLSACVKDFIMADAFTKRRIIISLLAGEPTQGSRYMAYLLYDVISNDKDSEIDTDEQRLILTSLPFSMLKRFNDAMRSTVDYTKALSRFDINKVPLEQQICLLKVNDAVKEKAMIKLREIKSKSDDSGSKARQYLDGLLRIPFNIYRRERIMMIMDENRSIYKDIITHSLAGEEPSQMETAVDIIKYVSKIKLVVADDILKRLGTISTKPDIKLMITNLKFSTSTGKESKCSKLTNLVGNLSKNADILWQNVDVIKMSHSTRELCNQILRVENNFKEISTYVGNVRSVLNKAVHGHDRAKDQLERIVCQWINGEQDGYCFGFEGPPGVGKTSLAKYGLSKCLINSDGGYRPFAMIQMGGDSNGSTLHGHNYTYVGSTWGDIVQILMDSHCMNPIIFIDEVDKISKTEHGHEIVGILTHLLDRTQNDGFQDKYFSGVELNLSKALFILSYNDPESIDKILLDRIHRVKFKSLSLDEKVTVCCEHLLPEIYKKMGVDGLVIIGPEVIRYIIDEYTCESGVRKLKEVLFDIIGAINASFLKGSMGRDEFPINLTIPDITKNYLKDHLETKTKMVANAPQIGLINGLWANSLGKGGVLPLNARFYPSDKFLELKLTGLQEKVMQESMHVALTVAWQATSEENKIKIYAKYNATQKYGIHIHTGDGSVPKDGPSASTAITCLIYSILNDYPIKNDYAITGEIGLDGQVHEIGGLDLKFIGGIKAGVKHFIFPTENKKDYDSFMEKYCTSSMVDGITFEPVDEFSTIFSKIFSN